MYVCICNAIRECELRHAAPCCQDGVEGVYARLGKQPQCRQCFEEAEEIIEEEREAAARTHLAAA